jgi:hypothetical protein
VLVVLQLPKLPLNRRSKIYREEKYRGHRASKKCCFYGFRIHLLVSTDGQPAECGLTYGDFVDINTLKYDAYELPGGSIIHADEAYNEYKIEGLFKDINHIELVPMHKKNSKRILPLCVCFVRGYYRKTVETTGILIEQLLLNPIHAVTPEGFELKVDLFVIAYSLDCYLNF